MTTIMDELTAAVANRGPYWESKNLIEPYFEGHILPKFQSALEEILPKIEQRHTLRPAHGKDTIECVHYTTIGRLVNILNEKPKDGFPLRLYDSVHLNDPDEGIYLLRHLTQHAGCDWIELDTTPPSSASKGQVAYIISFVLTRNGTTIEDDLVFWRTYGNEGKGCSLKFSIKHDHLKKVMYRKDIAKTVELLSPILATLSPLFQSSVDTESKKKIRVQASTTLSGCLRRILYLYKSSAYKYENEARIVILDSETEEANLHFDYQEGNVGRPRIRHYIKLDHVTLKQLLPSGSKITVGPTVPHPDNVCAYLEKMKRRLGLHGPVITASEISYRIP